MRLDESNPVTGVLKMYFCLPWRTNTCFLCVVVVLTSVLTSVDLENILRANNYVALRGHYNLTFIT